MFGAALNELRNPPLGVPNLFGAALNKLRSPPLGVPNLFGAALNKTSARLRQSSVVPSVEPLKSPI